MPATPKNRRGRGRPRGGDPAQTRATILAAAADLFADNGFRATSMVAVAEAAGLSQTGLLHHFPSKEALLAGVLERRDEQDMAAIAPGEAPGHGWEMLDQMASLVEHNMAREPFVRLFTSMAGEAIDPSHPGHDWLRLHHERARDLLTRGLREAQEDGTCDPDAPVERIAQVAVAVMDGLQLQWLMDPEGLDMAAGFRGFVEQVRARWELPATPGA